MINCAQNLTYVAVKIREPVVPVYFPSGSMVHTDYYICLANIHRPDPESLAVSGRQKGTSPHFFKLTAKVLNAVIATVFTDFLYTTAGMCQKKFCLVDSAVDHFVNTCGMKNSL